MANYTITYADSAQGFPSFYSYYPDWMIGMNNYFYTFKGGNLYRHNVNSTRNTFYFDWNQRLAVPNDGFTPTKLTSVFNQSPLENKLFKTLNLEGDDSWSATMVTDLQNSGSIAKEWFEKKESSWYAFVRNSGSNPATVEQYSLRSMNGLGTSTNITPSVFPTPPTAALTIEFPISPLVTLKGILSVGDFFYFVTGSAPFYAGIVTAVNVDLPRGINEVVIDTTDPTVTPIPSATEYFMFLKDSIAESHGVLGHYCIFDIENNNTEEINLFAVESDIMKSYP
jgi:hypothetical protein